jgi:hypothetical protein
VWRRGQRFLLPPCCEIPDIFFVYGIEVSGSLAVRKIITGAPVARRVRILQGADLRGFWKRRGIN